MHRQPIRHVRNEDIILAPAGTLRPGILGQDADAAQVMQEKFFNKIGGWFLAKCRTEKGPALLCYINYVITSGLRFHILDESYDD